VGELSDEYWKMLAPRSSRNDARASGIPVKPKQSKARMDLQMTPDPNFMLHGTIGDVAIRQCRSAQKMDM